MLLVAQVEEVMVVIAMMVTVAVEDDVSERHLF
jgi:hypothetical protein